MLCKVDRPVNSLSRAVLSEAGTITSLPLSPSLCSVWSSVLGAVEQWRCNPISVGSLGWPACECGVAWGSRQRPGACWPRPHSHTHTHQNSNWPTQMDSDEGHSGWFRERPWCLGRHNGSVCDANPVLSVISPFYFPRKCQIKVTEGGRIRSVQLAKLCCFSNTKEFVRQHFSERVNRDL